MEAYQFADPREAVCCLPKILREQGARVRPRGMLTYELTDVLMSFKNPEYPLAAGMNRKLNTRLAAVEALQLLAGVNDLEMLKRAAPAMTEYIDSGNSAAYGPRLREQLPKIVEMLRRDPGTRQAVAVIWRHYELTLPSNADRPCTTEAQFRMRDDRLHLTTVLRSQDIYRGMSYDCVMLTQLLHTVANVIGRPAGTWNHFVGSLHLYATDEDAIEAIAPPPPQSEARELRGLHAPDWESARNAAWRLLYDEEYEPVTETERWFWRNVRRVREGTKEGVQT